MAIHAPYHFVPLSPWIYAPPWGYIASRDIPFADGISGELHITLTNHSPLMIGGETVNEDGQPKKVTFLKDPNGNPCIPGTSLRGMIRNVLEIATFSKMQMVDEQRFGFRDFSDTKYKEEVMVNNAKSVKAGWLKQRKTGNGLQWQLTPVRYLPVTYADIDTVFSTDLNNNANAQTEINNTVKAYSQQDKYTKIPLSNAVIGDTYVKERPVGKDGKNVKREVYFKPTQQLVSKDQHTFATPMARLVFTGPMSQGKNTVKRRDYVFYLPDSTSKAKVVSDSVYKKFMAVHSENEGSRKQKNDVDLISYLRQNPAPEGIPVFWLADASGKPRTLGLAQLMKLPAEHSIHDTIAATQPAHIPTTQQDKNAPSWLDFCETLFGRVNATSGEFNRQGRISFNDAHLHPDDTAEFVEDAPIILGKPKASFFPAYLKQPNAKFNAEQLKTIPKDSTVGYMTYMGVAENTANSKKHSRNKPTSQTEVLPEISGWKRYPQQHAPGSNSQITKELQSKTQLQVKLEPIHNSVRFISKLRFHNLKPAELGALIWAITWNDKSNCFHGLGLAKPNGYGKVQCHIDVKQSWLQSNQSPQERVNCLASGQPLQATLSAEQIQDWQRTFIETMEAAYQQQASQQKLGSQVANNLHEHTWQKSEQITQLMAMATPKTQEDWANEVKEKRLSSADEDAEDLWREHRKTHWNFKYLTLKQHAENKSHKKRGKNALPDICEPMESPFPRALDLTYPSFPTKKAQAEQNRARAAEQAAINAAAREAKAAQEQAQKLAADREQQLALLSDNARQVQALAFALDDFSQLSESKQSAERGPLMESIKHLIKLATDSDWASADRHALADLIDTSIYLDAKKSKKQRKAELVKLRGN